jgi:hypothetical protein
MVGTFRQRVYAGKSAGGLGAFPPQSVSGAAAIDGPIVSRLGAGSAKLIVSRAAASGGPAAAAFNVLVQTGNDGAALSDAAPYAQLETSLNALAAGLTEYLIALSGAQQYIRVVITPTYTGGAAPANLVAAELVLGDYAEDPAIENETMYGSD